MKKSSSYVEYKGQKTTLLTWTSDMDAWSFSLPAGKEGACPMAVYGENSVCGSCYAQINRYNMPNVLRAQWIRFEWAKEQLKTHMGTIKLIEFMIDSINSHVENGYFRWFDSGDLFSAAMVNACHEICRNLPHIKFWFPTRSWQATSDIWVFELKRLNELENVVVRPSALFVNEKSPQISYLSAGTNVITENKLGESNVCPKTSNGGNCSSNGCRVCWDDSIEVSYLIHGFSGKHKMANATSDRIVHTRNLIKLSVLGKV